MSQDVIGTPEGGMTFEDGPFSSKSASPTEAHESPASPERSHEQARERAGEKYSEILSKVAPQTKSASVTDEDRSVSADAESVFSETDVEARVTKLLSLAEAKGPEHAVRVAIKLNDYYILDRVHDEMADKFYDALVAKGVIKE